MVDHQTSKAQTENLLGETVLLVGGFSAMPKKRLAELVRAAGGTIAARLHGGVSLAVIGDSDSSPRDWLKMARQQLGPPRDPGTVHTLRAVTEQDFWLHLAANAAGEEPAEKLYTPAMLAELASASVGSVRSWYRRGFLVPARRVQKLALFPFSEVTVACRLREMAAAGASLRIIERNVAALAKQLPEVDRPLAELPLVVDGKQVFIRSGDDLAEPHGQLLFDFDTEDVPTVPLSTESANTDAAEWLGGGGSIEESLSVAAEHVEEHAYPEAIEIYRTLLAAGGPAADVNFLLADALYAQGDLTAARERYFVVLELDEDLLEARASLGCVLAELGDDELAVATFRGALDQYEEFADVHFHLARTLDRLGRPEEALLHWQRFSALAPESPWADEARARLESSACKTR